MNKASGPLIARATAAVIALALGFGTPAEARELKIAHFMSPRHPMHRFLMQPMAEALAKLSGGALTAKIYPAGALGKGPQQQYKRVLDGVADIGFGLQGYTSAQFPRTMAVALPGMARDGIDATARLWSAYDKHLAPDYARVKLLALWTNAPSILISKRPIRTPADLEGKKIRAAGAISAKALSLWGATPVSMPVPKVYTAFNTGVIDAVMIGPSAILPFKLHEVGKYYTTGLPAVVTPFYLLMNRASWDGLSAEQQGWVTGVSGVDASRKAARAYAKAAAKGLAKAKASGGEIIALSPADAAAMREMAQPLYAQVRADLKAKGIDADALLAALARGR